MKAPKELDLDFSLGINAWNREALLGTDNSSAGYRKAHSLYNKEVGEGYFDDLVNFDFLEDGSLVSRGPIEVYVNTTAVDLRPNAALDRRGRVCTSEAQMDTGAQMHTPLVQVRDDSTGSCKFFRRSDTTPIVTKALLISSLCCAVYYNDKWYVYESGRTNAFHFTSSGVVTDFTAAFGIGVGLFEVIIWKDRAWGRSNVGNAIAYSKATDPTQWASPDGGWFKLPNSASIKGFKVWNDQLYILDSTNALWNFTYQTNPGVDGILTQVTVAQDVPIAQTGGAGGGITSRLAVSNGDLYVSGGANVYQYLNGRLLSISDDLHLELAGRDELYIFSLGDKLMAISYYWGSSDKNARYYVYHHNRRAWTRYEFDFFGNALDCNDVYIEAVVTYNEGYAYRALLMLNGSPSAVSGYGGTEMPPIYTLELSGGWFGNADYDRYWTAPFDGAGASLFVVPKYIVDSGVKFLGKINEYKKFLGFLVRGYLGYRQEPTPGSGTNKTPFKTTITPAPTTANTVISSTLQRTSDDDPTEAIYRINYRQRARGVRFRLETEDRETFATNQDAFTATEEIIAKPMIREITLLFGPTGSERRTTPETAYTDNPTI